MEPDARTVYGDIIDREYEPDPARPRMARLNRAAQFSPFAALTGYGDLIDESERHTDARASLDDDEKAELARRLTALLGAQKGRAARFTYFVPDEKKDGGRYETAEGVVVSVTVVPRRYFPSATAGTSLETLTVSSKFSFLSISSVQTSESTASAVPAIAAYSAAR